MNGQDVKKLLDDAKQQTGSDYKTAQLIGVPRFNLSNWRNRGKSMPPADVALVAQLGGHDPEAWALRAILEPYLGTKKGEMLAEALKKASLAIGGAMLTGGAEAANYFIRCIKSKPLDNVRPKATPYRFATCYA
jgi:hypothetical protein